MNRAKLRQTIWLFIVLIPIACDSEKVDTDGSDASFQSDGDSDSESNTNADNDTDTSSDGDSEADTGVLSSTGYAVAFADMIIDTWPDPLRVADRLGAWDYNNGIVLRGLAEVFEKTGDARYAAYIKQYVDAFVDTDGNLFVDSFHLVTIENASHNLDTIQPSILLLFLSEAYPDEARYSAAAARVLGLYESIPTNTQGGYWHKEKYPNEMWLDGLYMAEPFLARYGATNSNCGDFCFDMPVFQMSLLAENVRLPGGLFLHGWDEDMNADWCSGDCKVTGLSPEVWSRATGWFAMALVDTLAYLPDTHAGRATLEQLLQELARGVAANQDPASGLWCQVVDKCDDSSNWLESSGSAMLIYSLKRGVEMGVLEDGYLAVALTAWNGLIANMISEQSDQPVIKDAAKGMSIQSSYDAYTAISKLSNSAHGLCAVLLAAAAMEY